ncbi:PTS sugar transporter subunit IIA [Virgibacillus sp. LDC-1]|uniref:PTS sugar transporter subunit IIA n=1 Tax=Virgibacillus sp. LDC-1 TaxID=3039856 RepID=UPI0024DE62FE|nr:PTS sugar transporter subunit IIA [Virgibacillus sp. LDC-1]
MKFLEADLIKVDVVVESAEEAIQEAGNLLLNANLIEKDYVDAMINSYRKNGAYFVLAPQIAIPHARPEDGVNEASVSFVKLKEPINFGNEMNDPVQLVFGLGASNSDEHLALLRKLTTLLNNSNNVDVLRNAKGYEDIKKLF